MFCIFRIHGAAIKMLKKFCYILYIPFGKLNLVDLALDVVD